VACVNLFLDKLRWLGVGFYFKVGGVALANAYWFVADRDALAHPILSAAG